MAEPSVKAAAPDVVWVIHGPNLNRLGLREPEIYGSTTLAELNAELVAYGAELGFTVETCAHSSEGAIIDAIHGAASAAGIVINPAGYSHTSVAIADALRSVPTPAVEVHISNTYAREPFRHRSLTAAACEGVVMGLGMNSYRLGLLAVAQLKW